MGTSHYDPEKHYRRSIRLPEYDYSKPGKYFVTTCVKNHACILGRVHDGKMCLNEAGKIVANVWNDLPTRYPNVTLDEFVVMPNHVHGIVVIHPHDAAAGEIPESLLPEITKRRKMLLPKIIGRFKMQSAKQINILRQRTGTGVWQRNYWERIIRDDESLHKIRNYIRCNPTNWNTDRDRLHAGALDSEDT